MGLGGLFKKKEQTSSLDAPPSMEQAPQNIPVQPQDNSLPDAPAPAANDVPTMDTSAPGLPAQDALQPVDPMQNSMPDQSMMQQDSAISQPNESQDISLDVTSEPQAQQPSPEVSPVSQDQPQEEQLEQTQSFDDLPDFDESEEPSHEELESVPIRRESLLLKNIFVERDHYASMLISIKESKNDIQTISSTQRKLSNTELKTTKSLTKLSTIFDEAHENLMKVEAIIAKENV